MIIHLSKLFFLVSHIQINSICHYFQKQFCLFNFHQFNVLKLCLKKIDIRKYKDIFTKSKIMQYYGYMDEKKCFITKPRI